MDLDVTLKDAGLLVFNNSAKVTASNYPAHTVREKTNIFIPDIVKIDMTLVVDTTNSMQAELHDVQSALTKLTKEVSAGQRPTMALVEFKDDVRVKAFTQDTEVMLDAVAKLVAEGGGTCAEASPYPEADLDNLSTLIKGKSVKFNALISGNCTKAEDVNE